jgi:hypothetical protein
MDSGGSKVGRALDYLARYLEFEASRCPAPGEKMPFNFKLDRFAVKEAFAYLQTRPHLD